jgi:hypothetical protein
MASANEVRNRAGDDRLSPSSSTNVRQFPNKFAKGCIHCGTTVEAGEGISWKDGDKYKTAHKDGECSTVEPF